MRKSEFILAGKKYEVVDAVIEKLGRSLVSSEDYIVSKAKFLDDYIEVEVFYEYYENSYECEVVSEKFKISYDDLEF